MSIMTLTSWLAFIYVLLSINPEITNWLGLLLFYLSLFLSLIGTSALLGFLIRFIILKKKVAFRLVKEAFRQSFLFAFLIVISLILLSQDLFTWLNIFFLIISLSVLEFFMLSYEK
jgi:hypothetical protein